MENINLVEMPENEIKKPYELRTLEAIHVMPMVSILRKIGLKELKNIISKETLEDIISLFMGDAKNATTTSNEETETKDEETETNNENALAAIGISILPTALDVVEMILANFEKVETDIFKFLESISNLSIDEVKHLSLPNITEMIIDVIQKEEFKDFYKVVSKLFK